MSDKFSHLLACCVFFSLAPHVQARIQACMHRCYIF